MAAVSSWVLSIVGVVVIGVVVELIMPEGNISKYIKGFLAIFIVFIMISPLTNITIDDVFSPGDYVLNLDNDFLQEVNEDRIREYKLLLQETLSEEGYKDVSITFDTKSKNGKLEIVSIFVDLSKVVLNEKVENINIYNNIKNIIKNAIQIDSEDIIFSG